MQGQKDQLSDDSAITEVYWRTMDLGYVAHTVDEWLVVYREAFQHKKQQLFKLDQLRSQVINATKQEELDFILW